MAPDAYVAKSLVYRPEALKYRGIIKIKLIGLRK
jgi:hypothetical protein